MDEWMYLTSGEATHRQQTQRAMRQATHTAGRDKSGQRVRAALAAALIALASRIAPAPATLPSHSSAPVAPAQG